MEIVARVALFDANTRAILATVIDVRGSGYRLPGARMLILQNGETCGTVSGGCLETDVLERARKVLGTGKAEVFTYDTTADENSVFSLNMGCRGVIRILLEPIDRESGLNKLLSCVWHERRKRTLATYIGGDPGETVRVGERVFLSANNKITSGSEIAERFPGLDDDLRTFSETDAAYETVRYVNEQGEGEFAFESLLPPVLLLILGAGADAVPLARAGFDLGWQVRVYDHRPAFLTHQRFPDADKLVVTGREKIEIGTDADTLTAIVSINHNYDRDKESIAAALKTNAFYIGALGPKKRTEQILAAIRTRGEEIPSAALSRLRYPAGLDIGGDTPESIAVSIVAEIQSVLKQRPASPLRDRNGSIYDRKLTSN